MSWWSPLKKWSSQRKLKGHGARKNSRGGCGKVGLIGETWKKGMGCGATETKGSRHVQVTGIPILTWIMQLQ